MLDQVALHRVGQAVFVRPLRVAEDAIEFGRVGGLDRAHGGLQRLTHVHGNLTHLAPVGIRWDLETVVLRVRGELRIAARLGEGDPGFLVKYIAQAFEKQQRKDELLVVSGVDGPAQEHGRAPQVGFELLLGDAGHLLNNF